MVDADDFVIDITEFTDPGCPWAFSAEPFRRRIDWLYGERVRWTLVMVGLSQTPEEYASKGYSVERMAASFAKIAADHGMPIDVTPRPRLWATLPACRALVAARLHRPQAERLLLRHLRVRHFAGELLDEPATIAAAARESGIEPADLEAWMAEPATEAALRDDMERSRDPIPAARVLDHKLASWDEGRRYTCPSYEITCRTGQVTGIPGFQPWAVYDVLLANAAPMIDRREEPESVADVLAWSRVPLATQEVAVVCGMTRWEARAALSEVAVEQPVGSDGYWTLP